MNYIILHKDGSFNHVSGSTYSDLSELWEDVEKDEEYFKTIEDIYEEGQPQYMELIEQPVQTLPSEEEMEAAEYRRRLDNTDYTVIKQLERLLPTLAEQQGVDLEYKDTMEQRQIWRDRINEIESSYKNP